jgi:F-type H+-transporting ATPase subunit gamma
VMESFMERRMDECYLVYPEFVSTLTQRPKVQKILPIAPAGDAPTKSVDYIFEPDPRSILEELLPRYVEVLIYEAILEMQASEQSARMVAMRNANQNAQDLIKDLTLVYNKTRQAAITKELSEIVVGAAAV